jgi:predicted dithiol-disulfide oxidoreductase (DUF899 family)
MNTSIIAPSVVSEAEWVIARKELLTKENELLRLQEELYQERRDLPWVKVEKDYTFDTPSGKKKLADLFGDNSQLIVQHFMFAPGWKEGCPHCSFLADHIDGALPHLLNHDVSVVAISRAPLSAIEAFKKRMGWGFEWVSSNESDFNFDYQVSFKKADKVEYNYEMIDYSGEELPGFSVFYKDENGEVFHTYSFFANGPEILVGTLNFMNLTPKGHSNLTETSVKYHDKYDTATTQHSCCH